MGRHFESFWSTNFSPHIYAEVTLGVRERKLNGIFNMTPFTDDCGLLTTRIEIPRERDIRHIAA